MEVGGSMNTDTSRRVMGDPMRDQEPAKYAVVREGETYAVGEWTIDDNSEVGSYMIICRGIDDVVVAKNIAEACDKARPEHGDYM